MKLAADYVFCFGTCVFGSNNSLQSGLHEMEFLTKSLHHQGFTYCRPPSAGSTLAAALSALRNHGLVFTHCRPPSAESTRAAALSARRSHGWPPHSGSPARCMACGSSGTRRSGRAPGLPSGQSAPARCRRSGRAGWSSWCSTCPPGRCETARRLLTEEDLIFC